MPGDEDEEGTHDRPQRHPAGEGVLHRQGNPARHNQDQTKPPQHQRRPVRHRFHPAQQQSRQAPSGELPHSGPGVEVGDRLVLCGEIQREGEGGTEDGGHHDHHRRVNRPLSAQHQSQQGNEDPQKVELPLDGHRPIVLNGAHRIVALEVVDGLVDQGPILDVGGRRCDLSEDILPLGGRQEQDRSHTHGRKHHQRVGQKPGHQSPRVDPNAQPPIPLVVADYRHGHHESSDDEKDVNTA